MNKIRFTIYVISLGVVGTCFLIIAFIMTYLSAINPGSIGALNYWIVISGLAMSIMFYYLVVSALRRKNKKFA